MKRCEAKLLQEILQANKAELERQIWSRASRQLDGIKNAARRTSDSTNRTSENPVVPPVDRGRQEPGPWPGRYYLVSTIALDPSSLVSRLTHAIAHGGSLEEARP